jgi:hypothetical protein
LKKRNLQNHESYPDADEDCQWESDYFEAAVYGPSPYESEWQPNNEEIESSGSRQKPEVFIGNARGLFIEVRFIIRAG